MPYEKRKAVIAQRDKRGGGSFTREENMKENTKRSLQSS